MEDFESHIAKLEFRKLVLANRPQSSLGLTENLIQLIKTLAPKTIASYQPLRTEPDVSEFNDWALLEGLEIVFPRVVEDSLEFASGDLEAGQFGINSPTGKKIPVEEIDLVLVPALAVDRDGNRLGKGRGFYDRVLGGLTCPKFAVVFDSEVFDSIPSEMHDQKLSGAVTPAALLEFSSPDTV